MANRLESYAVAAGTGPRPRQRLHVLCNANEGRPICGSRTTVRYIGEVGSPDTEGWPWCELCVACAGPEVMSAWADTPA